MYLIPPGCSSCQPKLLLSQHTTSGMDSTYMHHYHPQIFEVQFNLQTSWNRIRLKASRFLVFVAHLSVGQCTNNVILKGHISSAFYAGLKGFQLLFTPTFSQKNHSRVSCPQIPACREHKAPYSKSKLI